VLALRRQPLEWERVGWAAVRSSDWSPMCAGARVSLLPLYAAGISAAADGCGLYRAAQTQLSDLWRTTAHIRRTKAARWLALAALSFGGFVLAPQSAVLIHRYRWWETDFITSLEQNLDALGGQRLSGHIQCIDSISGCGNVLYRMRLEPANGLLVDFPLFGADEVPFVRQTRERFFAAMNAAPPQVIVVSSALYVDGPGEFRKLDRWPAFKAFLAYDYTLETSGRRAAPRAGGVARRRPPATAFMFCAGSEFDKQAFPQGLKSSRCMGFTDGLKPVPFKTTQGPQFHIRPAYL